MSVVSYNQPTSLTSYRTNLATQQPHAPAPMQHVDPMMHLYNLEHQMEMAERRTASMMDDLVKRLDSLEDKVSNVSGRFENINRQLEKAVVALAQRVNSIEDGGAR